MQSNLSKNQELKSALLEETPWVLAAQSEEQQKKNIGLLFDLNRMSDEQAEAIAKIVERQAGNGGFSWFPGGRESWYMTQYIVEGMGHLDQLGVKEVRQNQKVWQMLTRAIQFIDEELVEHYNDLLKEVKKGNTKLEDDHLNSLVIHYLYTRTFFLDREFNSKTKEAFDYYINQAGKYWLSKGLYSEGMLALATDRAGDGEVAANIVNSLRERALKHDELGMYWKYPTSWWWYQAPIETHSLLIEVFDEVANDEATVEELKIWLLKNKQTTHWKTTKATAAAV